MIEMTVAMLSMATIGVFVVGVTVSVARQTNKTVATLPAETNAFRGLDRARQEVLASRSGSATISNNGRTIQFFDEGAQVTSQLIFDTDDKVLRYDQNTSQTGDVLDLGHYEDVTFETKGYGRYIGITVKEQGKNVKGQPVVMTRSEWLRVRN